MGLSFCPSQSRETNLRGFVPSMRVTFSKLLIRVFVLFCFPVYEPIYVADMSCLLYVYAVESSANIDSSKATLLCNWLSVVTLLTSTTVTLKSAKLNASPHSLFHVQYSLSNARRIFLLEKQLHRFSLNITGLSENTRTRDKAAQ